MVGRQRIYELKGRRLSEAERLDLCKLIIKSGYAVRLGKSKSNGRSTYDYYVEYWEE